MLHFIGIGAQKCGTTWLYEQLRHHPDIAFPAGKEVHFWDQHYAKGIEWYRGLFPEQPGKTVGEITPAYAILPPEIIKEVHKEFPEAKLLYIIRDPVERAWSSALMALGRSEMRVEEASDQWFIDHFYSQGSVLRGDYERCINHWLEYYDKEQLYVADFAEIKTNPLAVIQKVCQHIGADPLFYDQDMLSKLQKKVFEGSGQPIRKTLLLVLNDLYEEKRKFYNNIRNKETA